MIRVFCVFLVGEPLRLGDEPREVGFYRNEYVASSSSEQAIARAKTKTMGRLARKGAKFIEGKPFALQVESIKSGMPVWRLLRNEGFLFFPVEEQLSVNARDSQREPTNNP